LTLILNALRIIPLDIKIFSPNPPTNLQVDDNTFDILISNTKVRNNNVFYFLFLHQHEPLNRQQLTNIQKYRPTNSIN
jgi:hypothetical protein